MFTLLAIWLLNHSFNYKGFCTCMQVTVFKEFKDKFWFLRTFKDIIIFKVIEGRVGGLLNVILVIAH